MIPLLLIPSLIPRVLYTHGHQLALLRTAVLTHGGWKRRDGEGILKLLNRDLGFLWFLDQLNWGFLMASSR